MTVLVDTSVWIDFLRARATPAVAALEQLLESDEIVCVTPLVVQEILQGATSAARFRELQTYLGSLACYLPRDPLASHVEAARVYHDCRRAGLTPRSSNDCLIARVAIEHALILLHDDRDFDAISQVAKALQIYPL